MFALEVKALTKTYANGVAALKRINLEVASGDFFALLGPNGAGKTTAIGIISSLVTKSSGDVWVCGANLTEEPELVKSHIGIVPQEFNFNVFDSVLNIVITQAGYHGIARGEAIKRAEKHLKQLDIWDKRNAQARQLSGGMKRRLMIARALIHNPKLLILDEPTAGVDITTRRVMWEHLRDINKQGTTIILTTHYLEEAESLCRNVAIIDNGEIIANTGVNKLLEQMSKETFVLTLKKPAEKDLKLPNNTLRIIDNETIEIDVLGDRSINELFIDLSAANIQVSSLRNKVNRLEELFIQLTSKQNENEDKVTG